MKLPALWRGSAFSVFWIVPIILLTLIGGCFVYIMILGNSTEYINVEKGFKLVYPVEWTLQEAPFKEQPSEVVIFYSPKEGNNDKFIENVNIVILDMADNPMSLKTLTATALDQLSGTFKDVQVLSNEPITVGELPGSKFIFASKEESPLKIMTVLFVVDKKCYQIFYTAAFEKFDAYLPAVNDLISSFRLL